MITRENYEEYMVDYLEGNLSEKLQRELEAFLENNPDIKQELEMFDSTPIHDETIRFDAKEMLKKNISDIEIDENSIDEWCIMAIEGDLTSKNQEYFFSIVNNNPAFKKIYNQYKSTKLKDETVKLPGSQPYRIPDFNTTPEISEAEYWAVAAMENDLTLIQRTNWETFKEKNPEAASIEEQMRYTKLIADHVQFPNKNKLKRKSYRFIYPASAAIASAAAMLILYISVFDISDNTYENFNRQVAETVHPTEKYENHKSTDPLTITAEMQKQFQKMYSIYKVEQKQQANSTNKTKTPQQKRVVESIGELSFRKHNLAASATSKKDIYLSEEQVSSQEIIKNIYASNAQSMQQKSNRANELTLFKVAQKGVELVNKRTGGDLNLDKTYASNGQRRKVTFSSRRFSISKSTRK